MCQERRNEEFPPRKNALSHGCSLAGQKMLKLQLLTLTDETDLLITSVNRHDLIEPRSVQRRGLLNRRSDIVSIHITNGSEIDGFVDT